MIQITDKIRIRKIDSLNIAIERLSEGINPKTQEKTESWKTVGYSFSISGALRLIVDREMIDDINEHKRLEEAVTELELSHNMLLQSIEQIKEYDKELIKEILR